MFHNYFNSDIYNFKLIITKRPTNHRIESEYILPFDYFILDDYLNYSDFRSTNEYPNYEENLSGIFDRVDELYTYLDFTLLSSLIINWVKRNPHAVTHLVQEGVAGYNKNVMPLYKMVRFFLVYKYLKHYKGIKEIDFVYKWGYSSRIDFLRMYHPEKVKIKTRAKIEKLELHFDKDTDKLIKNIFDYRISLDKNKRYLLYLPIAQARSSAKAKQNEYALIDKLIQLSESRGFVFILKIKSGVDAQSYSKRFGENILVIDTKFPAEILISDIYNSIIISAFSSSALHNVNNNTYIWVYPILHFKTNLEPVTPDIKLIQSYPELVECIR